MNYKPPSLWTQVKTYAWKTGKHALACFPRASKKEMENRTEVCNKCPERNPKHNICNVCGCFLKMKIPRKEEKCDLGKW